MKTIIKSVILFILFITIPYTISAQEAIRVTLSGKGIEMGENALLIKKIENNAATFLSAINSAAAKKAKPRFPLGIVSSDAQVSLLSMWEMSRFSCSSANIDERLLKKPQGGFEIRNVPVLMEEAALEDKQQELVLIFDANGLIDNIYLSIETGRYNELVNVGNDVTEFRRRQIILDFIENFRTAYNRKDADYLSTVFSEDALIISGKVVRVSRPDASGQFLPQQTVTYQKQTKKEYINKLRRIFSSNAYINVKFEEIEIKQHKKYPTIYGVNMMQGWNTTRYSDIGYLLLIIDFSDDDKPLIHVRTWQPDKVGGKNLSQAEKFQLEQFNIKK